MHPQSSRSHQAPHPIGRWPPPVWRRTKARLHGIESRGRRPSLSTRGRATPSWSTCRARRGRLPAAGWTCTGPQPSGMSGTRHDHPPSLHCAAQESGRPYVSPSTPATACSLTGDRFTSAGAEFGNDLPTSRRDPGRPTGRSRVCQRPVARRRPRHAHPRRDNRSHRDRRAVIQMPVSGHGTRSGGTDFDICPPRAVGPRELSDCSTGPVGTRNA